MWFGGAVGMEAAAPTGGIRVDSFSITTWLVRVQFPFTFIELSGSNSIPTNIRSQIEVVIVTTILTIRIRCPKTVNLFNKAHQHMRGTSCTKFTLWVFVFFVTV